MGPVNGGATRGLAVGAHLDDDGGMDRGAVFVLFLLPNGMVKSHQKISDTKGNFQGVLDDSDYFGISVAALGDVVNGDATQDLAVGAAYDDDGGLDRGAVYILFLRQTDNGSTTSVAAPSTGGAPANSGSTGVPLLTALTTGNPTVTNGASTTTVDSVSESSAGAGATFPLWILAVVVIAIICVVAVVSVVVVKRRRGQDSSSSTELARDSDSDSMVCLVTCMLILLSC
jgi:hypothetical protein